MCKKYAYIHIKYFLYIYTLSTLTRFVRVITRKRVLTKFICKLTSHGPLSHVFFVTGVVTKRFQ